MLHFKAFLHEGGCARRAKEHGVNIASCPLRIQCHAWADVRHAVSPGQLT